MKTTYTSFNQLGSHLGVPLGNGLGAVPGFTIKWNNYLPVGKSIVVPTEISGFTSMESALQYPGEIEKNGYATGRKSLARAGRG